MDYKNKIARSISWMFVGIIIIITVLSDVFKLSPSSRNLIISVPIISYLIFNIIFALQTKKISKKALIFSITINILLLILWILCVIIKTF